MLSELIDVSSWTHEQWLSASILAFVILSILVVLHRMFKIFRMTNKSKYQPNLRPLRRRRYRNENESKNTENQ